MLENGRHFLTYLRLLLYPMMVPYVALLGGSVWNREVLIPIQYVVINFGTDFDFELESSRWCWFQFRNSYMVPVPKLKLRSLQQNATPQQTHLFFY